MERDHRGSGFRPIYRATCGWRPPRVTVRRPPRLGRPSGPETTRALAAFSRRPRLRDPELAGSALGAQRVSAEARALDPAHQGPAPPCAGAEAAARPRFFRLPQPRGGFVAICPRDRPRRLEKFSSSSASARGARAPRSQSLVREPLAELGLGDRGESARGGSGGAGLEHTLETPRSSGCALPRDTLPPRRPVRSPRPGPTLRPPVRPQARARPDTPSTLKTFAHPEIPSRPGDPCAPRDSPPPRFGDPCSPRRDLGAVTWAPGTAVKGGVVLAGRWRVSWPPEPA